MQFLDASNLLVESESDLLTRLSSENHTLTVTLVERVEESASPRTRAELEKADEAYAKLLQVRFQIF
jgi:hypothetical protein